MTTQTTTPNTSNETSESTPASALAYIDLPYLETLYNEGFDMDGPQAEREQHFHAIAELIGDIALAEQLREKAWQDRQAAENLATEFKTNRAIVAADRIEKRGFAEVAPTFAEQLIDETRTSTFRYNNLPSHINPEGWGEKEKTEIDGLRKLNTFLHLFVGAKAPDGSHPFPEDAEQAQSLLDNLTFIGEKELKEATRGLGMLWKNYLDEDLNRKICVLANISDSTKYPGKQKSDTYLRDRIFETFSPEDFQKYDGRIVTTLDDISEELPQNVRVVLMDDWTISGQQLVRAYKEIADHPVYRKFLSSVEANLLVASKGRLQNGLSVPDDHPSRKPMKVRAYYQSHHAENARTENKGHVSGLHSSANFDFADTIQGLVKRFEKLGVKLVLPSLASIVPPYSKLNQAKDKPRGVRQ